MSASEKKEFYLVPQREDSARSPSPREEDSPDEMPVESERTAARPEPELLRLPETLGTFGRKAGNDLQVDDHQVSKFHFAFVVRPESDEVEIRDLGSTNGTMVNGRRQKGTVKLREGEFLKAGSRTYRLQIDRTGLLKETVRLESISKGKSSASLEEDSAENAADDPVKRNDERNQ